MASEAYRERGFIHVRPARDGLRRHHRQRYSVRARTQDTNIAFLGKRLNALGVRFMEARVIPAKTICEPQCTA